MCAGGWGESCLDLGRPCKEASGTLSMGQGRREPTPWVPAASLFSLPLSLLSTTGRETKRTPEKKRKTKRERKGRDGESDGVRRTTLLSLVTSGNSLRWRQPLLTMCVKNARLEKIVASKVPPLSAWLAHKRTEFLPSSCSHLGVWELGGLGGPQGKMYRGLC